MSVQLRWMVVVTGTVLLGFSSMAAAQDAPSTATQSNLTQTLRETLRPHIGVRIGGYGFRHRSSSGDVTWLDCRMDGAGLMGTLDLSRHFFTEIGADFYAVSDFIAEDTEMDRISLHMQGALGVRMFPESFLTPYLQIGAGAEWTTISTERETLAQWTPTLFFGLGGDIDLGSRLTLGASLRIVAMNHPVHTHNNEHQHESFEDKLNALRNPTALPNSSEIATEIAPAGQAQFYVMYGF